jgi:hypothetical protein
MKFETIRLPHLLLLALLLFVPFLGAVHLFDWDEINFAECAREMIVTKNYLQMQIDYKPFFEKPPLFIWLQVLSMKVFGINEFAARFPNALAGMATFGVLYRIGSQLISRQFATIWTLLYASTWLSHFYFKSGIIDPVFNLFIFLAIYQVFLVKMEARKWQHVCLAGLFLGLAVLTKGPVALLVAGLCFTVYLILNRGLNGYSVLQLGGIALIALAVTASWFGIEWLRNGPAFIEEFLSYQVGLFSQNIADHEEPWYYHPLVLLIGCFPSSVFIFRYRFAKRAAHLSEPATAYAQWMWILFWVVLILFSIVKTKIVHYSSLCYYPLTFLAARQLVQLLQSGKLTIRVRSLLLLIGTLWGIILVCLPLVGIFKERLIPFINDPFAVGNLHANVSWHYWESVPGLLYLVCIWLIAFRFTKDVKGSLLRLFCLQIVAIQFTLLHFVPKVEAYSQAAAIRFYERMAGKDVHIEVMGFHSYAYLFYARKSPVTDKRYYNRDWLLHGEVDKPVYFVCKVSYAPEVGKQPLLRELYEENGFVFFERK